MKLLSPTSELEIRSDGRGDGHFGSSRKNSEGDRYPHRGLDIITKVGDWIKAPISGKIIRHGWAYKNDDSKDKLRSIHIKGTGEFSKVTIKILYCKLRVLFEVGDEICQGDVFALAQDNAQRYKGMINHMHIEIRINGVLIDPLEFFKL